jgi:hypothetical protein
MDPFEQLDNILKENPGILTSIPYQPDLLDPLFTPTPAQPDLNQQIVAVRHEPPTTPVGNPDPTPQINIIFSNPSTECQLKDIPAIQAFFHPEYTQRIYDVLLKPENLSPSLTTNTGVKPWYEAMLRDYRDRLEIRYDDFDSLKAAFPSTILAMTVPIPIYKHFLIRRHPKRLGILIRREDHKLHFSRAKIDLSDPCITSVVLGFKIRLSETVDPKFGVSFVKISETVRNPRIAIYTEDTQEDYYVSTNFAEAIAYFLKGKSNTRSKSVIDIVTLGCVPV